MLTDHVFDLVRVYVKPGNQNHIFLTINDAYKAHLVHCNDIAGREPAIFHYFIGGIRPLPVA
ncbi:hypothetical protein D3C87_1994800 [compost metagenome]